MKTQILANKNQDQYQIFSFVNHKNETKGITLIALILTIIILLILAGVTIATLTGENGILVQGKNAKEETVIAEEKEQITLAYYTVKTRGYEKGDYTGNVTVDDLQAELDTYKRKAKVEEYEGSTTIKVTFEETKNVYDINTKGEITGPQGIGDGGSSDLEKPGNTDTGALVEDIFDITGEEEGKLHIGDFINYTAGDWTEKDISNIAQTGVDVTNAMDLPSSEYFQFGGFTVGGSKDSNATPYNSSYAYVTDKDTGDSVKGWRLFDVTDGVMTLISAGCPEDFNRPLEMGETAYLSEYILTGNINSATTTDAIGTIYKARDWSMYVNTASKANSATVVTKEKLDTWYSKYMNMVDADTYTEDTFKVIYNTKYESLIDNDSYYWLSSAFGVNDFYYFNPSHSVMYGTR